MEDDRRVNVPFFVVGSQRSGTTLLRLMLNSHPNLAVPYETGFMTAFTRDTSFITPWHDRLARYQDLSSRSNIEALLDDIMSFPFVRSGDLQVDKDVILSKDIRSFSSLIDAIMTEYANAHGKKRWGDKTPEYTEDIDIIWRLFPGCKFVHLVRDGRDVVLRQLSVPLKHWFSRSMPLLAVRWANKTTICHKIGNVLGEKYYLEVRFEDLILEPEAVLSKICNFLGEPYSEHMFEYSKGPKTAVPRDIKGLSQKHVDAVHESSFGKLNKKMANTWKSEMSTTDRIIFEENAGHALDLFRYEREHLASTMGSKLKNIYYNTVVRY